jgi:hypothetical protein
MISNSPLFFYRAIRQENSIQELSKQSTESLIKEFTARAGSELSTVKELVEIYSIYIALTYKPCEEVLGFFEDSKKITYEWFSKIAEIFLFEASTKSTNASFLVSPQLNVSSSVLQSSNIR